MEIPPTATVKGTRPLNNNEIRLVSVGFTGTFEVRNRGLFLLGVSTGGRISELLSLQIGDVMIRNITLLMLMLVIFNIAPLSFSEDLSAKERAKMDANAAVTGKWWLLLGTGVCLAAIPTGFAIGNAIDSSRPCGGLNTNSCVTNSCVLGVLELISYTPNKAQGTGAAIGAAIGVILPTILVYAVPAHPPPERLLGKSSAYLEEYTQAYVDEARRIRWKNAGAGFLSGGCGGIYLLNAIFY